MSSSVSRAGGATLILVIQSLFNRVVGLITAVVLARLLFPEDFGIVAVSFAIVSVLSIITDLNVEKFVIAHAEKLQQKLNEIKSLRVKAKILCFIGLECIALLSYWVNPDTPYSIAIALHAFQLLFEAFYNLDVELHKISINFKTEANLKFIERITTTTIAISLAWLGMSYVALIIADLLAVVAKALTSHYIARCKNPFRTFWQSITEPFERTHLNDGFYFDSFIGAVRGKIDTLMFATSFKAFDLGLFNYAKNLTSIPSADLFQQVSRVQFSFLKQSDRNPHKLLRDFLYYTFSISALLYAGLIIFSQPIIHMLFGEHWLDMQPIFVALCIFAAQHPINACFYNSLVSQGHIATLNVYGIINLSLLCIVLIFACLNSSIISASYIRVIFSILSLLVLCMITYRLTQFSFFSSIHCLANGVAVICAALGFDFMVHQQGLSSWQQFVYGIPFFFTVLLSFLVIERWFTRGGVAKPLQTWLWGFIQQKLGATTS